ncbi:MAG: hypothetical protein QOI11_3866 [Candidatus Eremiobacteraeota bacterium]|nr:hypothetical protein [Candidatus Eremiobacteraeota bacterium]
MVKASGPEKRAVTFRIATDVLAQLEDESIEDGRNRESGRVYSPSATVERILRTYFEAKPKRPRRSK